VILQQSLADLGRAYRNWFADLKRVKAARAKGENAKQRARKPRYKTRHHQQAIRFTANARFRLLPNGRLRLPKMGDVKVRWSRGLPSEPSSVTVSLDGAGRYHASFVVEVVEAPLPVADTAVGVDLGLTTFAALSTGEMVDNPRWLRQREKALRRSQRNMARKRKGSTNREKARRKVARLHGHAGVQGRAVRADAGQGRPVVPVQPGLLGVWPPRRPQAPDGPRMDLPRMRHHPRPGPQRGTQHPGRRAGGVRLWSRCKTGGDSGGRRNPSGDGSRNHPGRCRMSWAPPGISAIQGGEEVKGRSGRACWSRRGRSRACPRPAGAG
jgi:hypothetical protein